MNDDPDAIVIEYDVPLPDRARNAGSIYPWNKMLVGGSFFRPTPPGKTVEKHRSTLTASANCFSKRQENPSEWRWLSAFEKRDGVVVGVRIWRAPPKAGKESATNPQVPLAEFVDQVRVVEAGKGRRVRMKKQPDKALVDLPPASSKIPRFVPGKRY